VQPNARGTQGYNLYAYVTNNPATWTDPTGHAKESPGGGGGAITYEQPVLAENWLEIALGISEKFVADCAEISPMGVCFEVSAQIIRIFIIIACVLEAGGPSWMTEDKRFVPTPPLAAGVGVDDFCEEFLKAI
jgi:hypothetical protein